MYMMRKKMYNNILQCYYLHRMANLIQQKWIIIISSSLHSSNKCSSETKFSSILSKFSHNRDRTTLLTTNLEAQIIRTITGQAQAIIEQDQMGETLICSVWQTILLCKANPGSLLRVSMPMGICQQLPQVAHLIKVVWWSEEISYYLQHSLF